MAAGDITTALSGELAIRLEDADESEFSPETKLKMLNKAQLEVSTLIHDAYLTELETVETNLTLTDSAIAFSALNSGNGVLKGREGIKRVKVSPGGSNPVYAIEIDLGDIKKTDNALQTYSDARPLFYIFNEKINIMVTTTALTTADVWFLVPPATMSSTVDPVINAGLHGILLDLAEAKCWRINRAFDRSQEAMKNALQQIEILNAKFTPAQGIGTKKVIVNK